MRLGEGSGGVGCSWFVDVGGWREEGASSGDWEGKGKGRVAN